MSLDTVVPRSMLAPPPLAFRAALSAALLLSAGSAAPLAAQDTLRPPATATAAAGAAALGHAASAPAVRVSLGEEALVPGDRGRVSVRTRAGGYVVVLQADPAGRVHVLFPLDPDAADQAVGADSDVVVRARGGGRDAFTAGSALGDGTVLAAFSVSRPFRAGRFARNGHWDPRTFPHVAAGADAEGELLAFVGELLPGDARFDYDVATYRVSEPLPVAASAAATGGDEGGYAQEATATDAATNAYDGNVAMAGAGGYYDTLYDDYFGGYYSGYYGGIFPIVVVVPSSFRGVRRRRGFYPVGLDPFFLSLGCPPVFFSPYAPFPRYGGGGRRGRGHDGYGVVYTGPRSNGPYLYGSTPPAASKPYSYKNRPPATSTTSGPTIWRSRGGDEAQSGAAVPESPAPAGWTPMRWHPMTDARPIPANDGGGRRAPAQVLRGAPPARLAPPPSSSRPAPSVGNGPAIWHAPAHSAPAAPSRSSSGAAPGNGARVSSPGGARARSR